MSQRNRMGQQASPLFAMSLWAGLLALWAASAPPARAGEDPTLVVRSVERAEGGVRFDLELAGGLTEEQLVELDQGERVTVRWEMELVRDRKLWFNTTVAKLELVVSAVYDPLTQRYSLERRAGKELLDSAEAGDRAGALDWLTRVREAVVSAPEKVFERPRLRWRVRAVLDRRLVLLVLPTTVATNWGRGEFADSGPGEAE